jgi:hypothetical protein
VGMQTYYDFDIKEYLTFGTSAKVKEFVVVEREGELKKILENYDEEKKYYFL